MVRLGTMRNGVIIPDEPDTIPEGTRITLDFPGEEDDGAWPGDCPPPPATETREELIASLREDLAEIRAGVRGKTLEEFAAELKREFGVEQDRQ